MSNESGIKDMGAWKILCGAGHGGVGDGKVRRVCLRQEEKGFGEGNEGDAKRRVKRNIDSEKNFFFQAEDGIRD